MLPNLYVKAWTDLKQLMPQFNITPDDFMLKWGEKFAQKGTIEYHTSIGLLSKENGDFLDHTLIHGDYSINNFMMDMRTVNDGSIQCDAKGDPNVYVMDWQDLTSGPGQYDLTYYMTYSCSDSYRKQFE